MDSENILLSTLAMITLDMCEKQTPSVGITYLVAVDIRLHFTPKNSILYLLIKNALIV